MKHLRHGLRGHEKPGLLDADGTPRDLSGLVPDIAGAALSDAGLDMLCGVNPAALPKVAPETRLGPCVGGTGKYICIGMNYSDHVALAGIDTPEEPLVFMKATSAICGPTDPIVLPRGADKTDWEVELAAIVGTRAKYLSPAQALDHVAGYAVTNDVSERAFQSDRGGETTKGKSADGFGQLGPWLVTRDEVPVPQDLSMWLTLDSRRMQNGSTRTMIFSVAEVVSHLSQFMTLEPIGSVFSSTTTARLGRAAASPSSNTKAMPMPASTNDRQLAPDHRAGCGSAGAMAAALSPDRSPCQRHEDAFAVRPVA